MANNFTRYPAKDVGTTAVSLLTVGASTQATVIGISCSNTTNSVVLVDVYATMGGVDYYIIKNGLVPSGGALIPVGGDMKVVLITGDILKVKSSVAASIDVIASVLNIT